jgi:PIN domain nuclease of toxin-antitoxin system
MSAGMTILLDSHTLFWWASSVPRLSVAARSAIENADRVCVSPVTAWEITTKVRSGKWSEAKWLAERFFEVVASYEFEALPLTLQHAHLAGSMPGQHRDPFDRLLAAQARIEDVPLVTADHRLDEFGIQVIW